ncbi:MAG: hypothetical protein IT380_09340 [Myxococcales bacterium]|nr:hypothetical protein [Myxococcales bacterium]
MSDAQPDWAREAQALQRDGYTAAVVARKLIELHGVPREQAEAVVGRLYGTRVDAYAGEQAGPKILGIALVLIGLAGAAYFFREVGARTSGRILFVYFALAASVAQGIRLVVSRRP